MSPEAQILGELEPLGPHEVSAYAVAIQLLQTKQQRKYVLFYLYYFIFYSVYNLLFYLCLPTQRALVQNQNFAWGNRGQGKGTEGQLPPATLLEPPLLTIQKLHHAPMACSYGNSLTKNHEDCPRDHPQTGVKCTGVRKVAFRPISRYSS